MIAVLTLLHLLVLVYWLGGDLGAFYAGGLLADSSRPVAGRAAVAKILAGVDMAPRTALILAVPTGLSLAMAKSWVAPSPALLIAIWVFALIWLGLAWRVHLKHLPPTSLVRRIDIYIRLVVLAALVLFAGLALIGKVALPLFIAIKLLILAATIVAGLIVRRQFRDFGPAFTAMMATGPTPETDTVIRKAILEARPVVMTLWALLLGAALLGLATPI